VRDNWVSKYSNKTLSVAIDASTYNNQIFSLTIEGLPIATTFITVIEGSTYSNQTFSVDIEDFTYSNQTTSVAIEAFIYSNQIFSVAREGSTYSNQTTTVAIEGSTYCRAFDVWQYSLLQHLFRCILQRNKPHGNWFYSF